MTDIFFLCRLRPNWSYRFWLGELMEVEIRQLQCPKAVVSIKDLFENRSFLSVIRFAFNTDILSHKKRHFTILCFHWECQSKMDSRTQFNPWIHFYFLKDQSPSDNLTFHSVIMTAILKGKQQKCVIIFIVFSFLKRYLYEKTNFLCHKTEIF